MENREVINDVLVHLFNEIMELERAGDHYGKNIRISRIMICILLKL